MIGVLLGKLKVFIRTPGTFLAMTILTLVFALVFSLGDTSSVNVPVYETDEGMRDSVVGELLNDTDAFQFQWMTHKEVEKEISDGNATTGVEIRKDGYKILVGVESGWTDLIGQMLNKAYMEKMQFDHIIAVDNEAGGALEEADLQASLDEPVFSIEAKDFQGEDGTVYDQSHHALFGFTLFFVIFTISSNVFHILDEKKDGIWDRLILSPVKKWEMYAGNFIYSFLTGYSQILVVFFVFRYVLGVDFGGNLDAMIAGLIPYVFAIVSLCILITGIVKTGQQYNLLIAIASMAMGAIGGVFWSLEVVESEWMLALSKLDPVTYGMEIANGIADGNTFGDLLLPISILLLMGVVFTGIGIHLMEKRHV